MPLTKKSGILYYIRNLNNRMNKTLLMEAYLATLFESNIAHPGIKGADLTKSEPVSLTTGIFESLPPELKAIDEAIATPEVQVIIKENPGFSLPINDARKRFAELFKKYPVVEITKSGHTYAKRTQDEDGVWGRMLKVNSDNPLIPDEQIWKYSGLAAEKQDYSVIYDQAFYPELDSIINETVQRLYKAFEILLAGYKITTKSGKEYSKKTLGEDLKKLNLEYKNYVSLKLKSELAEVYKKAHPELAQPSNLTKLKSLVFNKLVEQGAARPLNRKEKPESKPDVIMDSFIPHLSLYLEALGADEPVDVDMSEEPNFTVGEYAIEIPEVVQSHILRAAGYLKNIELIKSYITKIDQKYKDVLIRFFDAPEENVDVNDYKSHNKTSSGSLNERGLSEILNSIKQIDREGNDVHQGANVVHLRKNGLQRFNALMRIFKYLLLKGGKYQAA